MIGGEDYAISGAVYKAVYWLGGCVGWGNGGRGWSVGGVGLSCCKGWGYFQGNEGFNPNFVSRLLIRNKQ